MIQMNTQFLNRFEQYDLPSVVVFDTLLATKVSKGGVPLVYTREQAEKIADKISQYPREVSPYEVMSLKTYQLRYDHAWAVAAGEYVPLYMFPGQWVQAHSATVLDTDPQTTLGVTVKAFTPGEIVSVKWDETNWLIEVKFEGFTEAHWMVATELDFIDMPEFKTGQRVDCGDSAYEEDNGLGVVIGLSRGGAGDGWQYRVQLDQTAEQKEDGKRGRVTTIDESFVEHMLCASDAPMPESGANV